MATTPLKLKPVTPPKPLAHLNVQCRTESETIDPSYEFSKSKKTVVNEDSKTQLNSKTDKEGNAITLGLGDNTKAVSSRRSGGTLPPKPALLPKPQPPTQKFTPKERPQIPRRPETSPSKAPVVCPQLKRSATTLPLLSTRAPVAKLEEFDCLYGSPASRANPVRPPRSPKIKLFPGGPFNTKVVEDDKPELPAKKRPFTFTSIDKKKSLSLGRNENIMHLQAQQKSVSLVRNLRPNDVMIAHKGAASPSTKPLPIPPPRRRKKSEDMASQLAEMSISPELQDLKPPPIYAQVNYEMKKNRRELVAPISFGNTPLEVKECSDQEEVVQGRLVLTKDNVETNCHTVADSESVIELLSLEVDTTHPGEGYKLIADSNLILSDKTKDTDNLGDSMHDSLHQNKEAKEEMGDFAEEVSKNVSSLAGATIQPRKSQLYQLQEHKKILKTCDHEAKTKADLSLVGANSPDQSSENCVHGIDCTDSPSLNENIPVSPFPIKSELFRLNSENATKVLTCDNSHACNTHAEDHETTAYSPVSDNTNETFKCQAATSTLQVMSKFSETLTEGEQTNPDKYDKCRPLSMATDTSELMVTSNMVETWSENAIDQEGCKDMVPEASRLWRRQSWSSSKDTTPSPDRGSLRKQGQWCDEGDLSNGALADSDSSDNIGRKATNELESVHRSKNKNFWSFGKGSKRKERKQREPSSQFYNSELKKQVSLKKVDISGPSIVRPSTSVDSVHVMDGDIKDRRVSKEAQQGQRLKVEPSSEAFGHDSRPGSIKRSPSGVSDILDNLGSSPAFDGERDSESENEDRNGDTLSRLSSEQQRERKVFYIAQELMTSEQQFVDVLKLINIDFIDAVKNAGSNDTPVIPPGELSKIINNLPQLQGFNEELLSDLNKRIKNWSSNPKISDIIVKKGPFLKLYSSYIRNFEMQCSYLDECCQKYPRFAKVVKEFEASPVCKKLELKHFMLKPVQRIPQYRLLLEDYQRHLDPAAPDVADTEAALRIVRDVADHANHTLKLGDHLSKLIELQSQLVNYEIITPGRTYIKDGELKKLSRKVPHPRYFILLSDCLLYTSKISVSQIRVNKELPLQGMVVSIPQIADDLNEFNIVSITRSFTLSASSQQERQEWVAALENAIREDGNRKRTFQASELAEQSVLPLGYRAPVWIPDDRVTMCQSCTAPFTVIFRRHHCRACGKVVCGVCLDNRAPLRFMGYRSEKVCGDCHDTLMLEFEGSEAEHIKRDIMGQERFGNMSESAAFDATKALFKISGAGNKKKLMIKKDIPKRLKEVAANDSGSQMSGWLQRRGRRSWKRLWFVLKDQILYVYKASEDVVALESIPILGYKVEPMAERHFQIYEGIDAALVFQLAHLGQLPLVFHADTVLLANRWMTAMEAATILE